MDTKWKRFKFSSGNKLLCVLLALLMVACLMSNAIQLAKFISFYEEDVYKQNTTSFYETGRFSNLLYGKLDSIQHDVTYKAREKRKQAYIENFYAAYKKAEKENRLSDEEAQALIDQYKKEQNWDEYYEEFGEYPSNLSDIWVADKHYYRGDDGYYYSKFMYYSDQRLNDNAYADDGIAFGRDEYSARNLIGEYYDKYVDDIISYIRTGIDDSSLKNIQFYAVHNDGTVVTNVETDINAFIQSVKNGDGDSIAYEPNGKGYYASGNLVKFIDYDCFDNDKSFNAYIQIDSEFKSEDGLRLIYLGYLDVKDADFNLICINILVSFVLLIALAVISCRLAGHKEGELSMAKIDKMPFDLHFALMGTAVGLAGAGMVYLIDEYVYLFRGFWFGYNNAFYGSGWFIATVCAISMLIWLMILGFATSLSRAVKCDYPIFSKLLVVRILVLIFKVLKWIIKRIARVIVKMFKGTGKLLKVILTFAFRPKKLHKLSVPAVVFYTLFNLVSFGIILLLFSAYESFLNFCGFLGTVVVLGADGYLVYKAVKYMKSLDDIIGAS
ncbi:MAG: YlbF family regulator, partial [Eubacterium sp.]|nr:YlbF family regulator [Eubacterium sp.]